MNSIVDEAFRDMAPRRLYHYTNLESLALILKNKTLRLMPLTSLDDPQESMTFDSDGVGRYIFVSCWTEDGEESIPMWNMYAGLDSGVRIEMDLDPFHRFVISSDVVVNEMRNRNPIESVDGVGIISFVPIEDMRKCFSTAALSDSKILQKITYTADPELLFPQIVKESDEGININYGAVGIYKNEKWSFQKEWRYIISCVPFDLFGEIDTADKRMAIAASEMLNNASIPLFNHFDLYLDDSAIRRMRFVLSPKISEGNKVLAETLLRRFGLENNLEDSELLGLL